MIFLPFHCDACRRTLLLEASGVQDNTSCDACGTTARALGSLSYDWRSSLDFRGIAKAVNDAGLTVLQAQGMLDKLKGAVGDPRCMRLELRAFAHELSSVTIARAALSNDGTVVRSVAGMLAIVLGAHANV